MEQYVSFTAYAFLNSSLSKVLENAQTFSVDKVYNCSSDILSDWLYERNGNFSCEM